VLNDQVGAEDAFLEGIPYPGVFVTDENGIVVAKFFHDTYKKRDSPEMLIDAALGRLIISDDVPSTQGGDSEVKISVYVHGGKGTIRQGIRRQLIVRFELEEGIHLYGEPGPEGMISTRITIGAPPGLVVEEIRFPPTKILRIASMNTELPVWSGVVDVVIPFYATSLLASETRPLDQDSIQLKVQVRYQACSDDVCFLPKTKTLELEVGVDVVDVPALGTHLGHGQRESNFSATPHMVRLMFRKLRKHPLGLLHLILKTIRLEIVAKRRSLLRRRPSND